MPEQTTTIRGGFQDFVRAILPNGESRWVSLGETGATGKSEWADLSEKNPGARIDTNRNISSQDLQKLSERGIDIAGIDTTGRYSLRIQGGPTVTTLESASDKPIYSQTGEFQGYQAQGTQPSNVPASSVAPTTLTNPELQKRIDALRQLNPNITQEQINQIIGTFPQGTSTTPTPTPPQGQQIPSTLTEQRRLAQQLGIQNFTGTPEQMAQLQQAVQGPPQGGTPAPATTTGQYQNLLAQTGFLKTGAQGAEVQQLQQFLQAQGYDTGPIDGKFGPKTANALKQFQQASGIGADAIVGPETRKAIQDRLGTGGTGAGSQGVAEGGEPNQQDQDLFGILQGYGLDIKNEQELADAFKFQPTRTFEELYKDLYEKTGLDKVKDNIDKTIAKLKEVDDKHQKKVGEINENPWISESLRVKKLGVEDNRYQSERGTEAENLQLLQRQFEQAQDEIKFTAKQTLDQFYKERKFEQDELERILKRAEDELSSRTKAKAKEDRELTIAESQKLGVPIGTKLSEVKGKTVPTKSPTTGTTTTKTQTSAGVKFSDSKTYSYFNTLPKAFRDVFTRGALTGGAYTFTLKEVQDNYASWQKRPTKKTSGTSGTSTVDDL
jgi:hypothetical protein